jgi:spore coat protein U-like protein
MKRFRFVALALALVFSGGGIASHRAAVAASPATTSLQVSTTVVASCTISTTPVAFGNYDPVFVNKTTPLLANGTVTVACTSGSTASIGLNEGGTPLGGSSTVLPLRQMALAGTMNRIRYDLFQDSSYVAVWGDVGTTAAVAYLPTTMAPSTFTIYGRVGPAQDVPLGTYNDTVTASITF